MINLFITLALMLFSFSTHAFIFSSQMTVNSLGELSKTLNIQCSSHDNFCYQTCGNKSQCVITETFCEDCATASSAILHTVFTDLSRVFKSELTTVDQIHLSQFFQTKKFMTLSHDSFLNLFTPEKKIEIKREFESLCYIQNIQSVLLITTLNEQNQIDQLVGAICQDQKGQSVVLPMQYNPLFSNKRIYFWPENDDMQLNLKRSEKLSLP